MKYLQVSTDEVYGSLGDEGYFTEETPIRPHSPYSASKASADLFGYGIDPHKISEELGWYPETKFEDGIKLTLAWYNEHKEWIEHITSGQYQEYYKTMYEGR